MKTIILLFSCALGAIQCFSQTILGIDVSHHQGTVNWAQVAADGKEFAWIKATQDVDFVDPRFTTNMTGGINAGVVMGAYHFAEPQKNTGAAEANHFLSIAGNYIGPGFLPPVLDIEDNPPFTLSNIFTQAQLTQWCEDWVNTVRTATGVTPVIYTSTSYTTYLNNPVLGYDLWIAKPGTSPNTPPNNIGNWPDWAVKQYSWTGTVSGISGDVDLNVFNGDMNDFNDFISGVAPAPPANDDCSTVQSIQSSTSCSTVGGSVNRATTDGGFAKPSCDNFSNPLGAGVFYSFVAQSTSHTISVQPTGNLDAVLTIYSGVNCSNLSEIECEDTQGGAGVTTEATVNNLTVGSTYWIRVYDYGSQPPSNGDFDICVTHSNTPAPQDVTITNATATTSTDVNPGGTVGVSAQQNYSGFSSSLPNVILNYYLSTDCTLDGSDIFLGDDFSTINSNTTSETETVTVTIPSNTTGGTYNILLVADHTDVVDEADEGNNTACIPITVSISNSSDITIVGATATSSTNVDAGGTIAIRATQNYSGSEASLPDVTLNYYLSVDCSLDGSDILLGDDVSTINSNNTSETESAILNIPGNTTGGTYNILLVADHADVVDEINEGNNTACVPITVSISGSSEDVIITSAVPTSSTNVDAGDNVIVRCTQNYSGPSTTHGDIVVNYYLSTDCTFDGSDVFLDAAAFSINATNNSATVSSSLTIPSNTATGTYNILALGDGTNIIAENDESNNSECITVNITGIPPPLSLLELPTSNLAFSLFPNPNKGNFQLALNFTENIKQFEVLVSNNLGQQVYGEVFTMNDKTGIKQIGHKFIPGTYFVTVKTSTGSLTKLMLVE